MNADETGSLHVHVHMFRSLKRKSGALETLNFFACARLTFFACFRRFGDYSRLEMIYSLTFVARHASHSRSNLTIDVKTVHVLGLGASHFLSALFFVPICSIAAAHVYLCVLMAWLALSSLNSGSEFRSEQKIFFSFSVPFYGTLTRWNPCIYATAFRKQVCLAT